MRYPNVCFVVARRAPGDTAFVAEPDIYVDDEDALQRGCELQEEEPESTVRLLQVILDPAHPSTVLRAVRDTLGDRLDDADEHGDEVPPGYEEGLREAIDVLEDAATLVTVEEAINGGRLPPSPSRRMHDNRS